MRFLDWIIILKIENSDDDDRDGTPSASCQNGVEDGAVQRWDILRLVYSM